MLSFSTDPRFSAIAITGGPCAGKSTFLAKARQWLENRGLRVAVLAESATDLITGGLTPWNEWLNPIDFQRAVLERSLSGEEIYYRYLKRLKTDQRLVLLCDRGTLDGIAYAGREGFLEALEGLGLDLHALRERYKAVIHLVTAADGAPEHYTLANNEARTETPEQALALDRATQNAWLGHQHLAIIDNSAGTFQRKMERALTALARTLHMPEPLEAERKFLVKSFDLSAVGEVVQVRITQDYLISPKGCECRVRTRYLDGVTTYYHTEKRPTETVGVRTERERQITQREYEELLRRRDPSSSTVVKVRHTFVWAGRHLELDIYEAPINDTVILEVELPIDELNDPIEMPPGFDTTEMTGDEQYDTASIARGSLG